MKNVYRCLVALLCAACLTIPAMADLLSPGPVAVAGGLLLILLGLAAIAAAIIIVILSKRKK